MERPIPNDSTWHRRAKFGIIIHWGVYSVPAYDVPELARRRKIMNGSEWYLQRLTATYRIGASHQRTREYYAKTYPNQTYESLARDFTASKWNVNEWAELFGRVGARYVVITAKHHDGYCLWPTRTAPGWNSMEVGPKRDIVGELATAVRNLSSNKYHQGVVRFGLYYSWHEWSRQGEYKEICTREYVRDIVSVQLKELSRYSPSLIFFDGDWPRGCKYWNVKQHIEELTRIVPDIAINDRLGNKDTWMKLERNNGMSLPTYRTFADRTTPTIPIINTQTKQPWHWEHIDTIGLSWGYNKMQAEKDYKTVEQLVDILVDVVCKGGCLLLNIAPDSEGQLDKIEVERLEGLGRWLKDHSEAVYDTHPGNKPLSTVIDDGTMFIFERASCYGGWTHRLV